MEINLVQKRTFLSEQFSIYTDGMQTHRSQRKQLFFSFRGEIKLFDYHNDIRFILSSQSSGFKISYSLIRYDKRSFYLKTSSLFKSHYQCQVDDNLYDIYGHTGLKYSVYKNDSQVAWWDSDSAVWFDGKKHYIISDDDCDVELIISICLIIVGESSNRSSTLSFDFGHIGPQTRKFDDTWIPRTL